MGKKKSRRNNNSFNKAFISSPSASPSPKTPAVVEDEIGEELAELEQNAQNQQPIAAPRKSLSALNLDYDEFDHADIEIPLNSEVEQPDKINLNAPKHAYQTVYMSHENVTSPIPRDPISRSNSVHSNKDDFGNLSSNLQTARSGSVSSNYNKLTDGGAYESFRASHQNLVKPSSTSRNYAHGDCSYSSFLSDAAGERSLAGFPTSAFGGSRASIQREEDSDDDIQILREIPRQNRNQIGELERLNIPDESGRRSRLNSRNSGVVGFENGNLETNHQDIRSSSRRSRTVSNTSRQSGPSTHVLKTASSQQLPNEVSEDVRTYHADSEYLQNRLSKLSIHTNNDEFVLVGGHPPDFGGRSNIPSIRGNDDTTFHSDSSRNRENESVFSISNESHRSKSMSRGNLSSANSRTVVKDYGSNRDMRQSEEILGRSISQNEFSDRSAPISRNSSRHTIGTTSNTDDRLLLAAKYSRLPEAEGLIQIPISQSTTSNVHTLVGTKSSLSRTSSICSNKSDRVNFAEIPTLFSHPDDHFGEEDNNEGEPFRPTKEHQYTPSNKGAVKTSLREKALDDREPEKALFVTSALTPVASRAPVSTKNSVSDSILQTPQTVVRNQEVRCIRQIMQPLTTKNTAEIAIQTGNTIRLRQGKWNPDVLSQFVDANYSSAESPIRPKMNNSFEKNGHPAVSILSNMLQNRLNSPKATPVSSDSDVRSSQSNSSHQVTMVHQTDSQTTVLNEQLRHIADRYKIDENANTQFTPLSTSTPSKNTEKKRRNGISSIESLQEQALQKTGSEKSINSVASSKKKQQIPEIKIDARWVEEKKSNGDTIRKHVPRGRIRDLAQAFDTMQMNSPKNELPVPNYRKNYWKAPEDNTKSAPSKYISEDRIHSSSDIRSRSSSNRLDGSTMSSNIFLPHTSSNNINDRHRSTSSSLSNQPNVFTRNTFLRTSTATSNLKPGAIPTNVPMSTTPINGQESNHFGGFVSQFERIPSINKLNVDNKQRIYESEDQKHFKEDPLFRRSMPNREPLGRNTKNTPILRRQTAVIEIPKNSDENGVRVPIQRVSSSNQVINNPSRADSKIEVPINRISNPSKYHRVERAKTQEVTTERQYQPTNSNIYETKAVSGEIGMNLNNFEDPFKNGRDLYGRQTTENLSMIRTDGKDIFEEKGRNLRNYEIENDHRTRPLEVSPKLTRQQAIFFDKHPSKLNISNHLTKHSTITITRDNLAYSPPATEDAGSRITHLTQSLQDGSTDRLLTAEGDNSTIRGKIDRMFDFVDENEEKNHRTVCGEETSTISSGTLGRGGGRSVGGRFEKNNGDLYSPNTKFASYLPVSHQRSIDEQGEWERTIYKDNSNGFDERHYEKLQQSAKKRNINSPPDRRNTVAIGGGTATDSDFEYSLSQYREMQREQLLRRLPSIDEPQFFRSPTLIAPHAGQSINAYRSKDLCGTPTAGEKIRLNPSYSGCYSPRNIPTALATSTPMDSPSSISSSFRKAELNNNIFGESGIEGIGGGPHDTFVSSISGVSANEKQVDFMKRINRLSYMIENTQKQMSLNEAVLMDAIKKGKQSQEIAANRSILISRETLRLQRSELRRLHAISAVRRPPPPVARNLKGSVIFSNVMVHLNKNFCSRLTTADDMSYAFVALFKNGHQVEATEYLALRVVHNNEVMDRLIFEKPIQFSDVSVDFTVTVEFYAMKVQPPKNKQVEHTSFATRCKNFMGPPQKKTSQVASSETAFKMRGRIVLDREAAGERCFYLDDVTYPLEGTMMINTKCSRLPDVFEEDFKGFLTMFSANSSMVSWDRYWAVLRRGIVFLWKYPDEEQQGKEPRMQIDLTKCTNNSIEKCSFDVCPRPNSFMIEILVESNENPEQSTIGSIVEKKRVLLSADTDEMLSHWLFSMNQTLDVIRGPI